MTILPPLAACSMSTGVPRCSDSRASSSMIGGGAYLPRLRRLTAVGAGPEADGVLDLPDRPTLLGGAGGDVGGVGGVLESEQGTGMAGGEAALLEQAVDLAPAAATASPCC